METEADALLNLDLHDVRIILICAPESVVNA